jgi:putative transposase
MPWGPADGSCARLRAEPSNHVRSHDFIEDRTHDGREFGMLCVIDEFTREASAILFKRRLNAMDFLKVSADLIIVRGAPGRRRPDAQAFCPDHPARPGQW